MLQISGLIFTFVNQMTGLVLHISDLIIHLPIRRQAKISPDLF